MGEVIAFAIGMALCFLMVRIVERPDAEERNERERFLRELMLERKDRSNRPITRYDLFYVLIKLRERPERFNHHGGCLPCRHLSETMTYEGLERCSGCLYFTFDQSLPDLSEKEA